MTGIHFLTDEAGRKTAGVIDLKKHRALWEDIADVLVSRSRRHNSIASHAAFHFSPSPPSPWTSGVARNSRACHANTSSNCAVTRKSRQQSPTARMQEA
jgi:hypothetical protein